MLITIDHEPMSPIFDKFHLKGLPFNAVLHRFTEPDTGDPHNHPFGFTTHILKGSYIERVFEIVRGNITSHEYIIEEGTCHYVSPNTIHQIIDLPEGDCYTLIIPEIKVQEPGFFRFENGKVYNRFHYEKEFKEYIL